MTKGFFARHDTAHVPLSDLFSRLLKDFDRLSLLVDLAILVVAIIAALGTKSFTSTTARLAELILARLIPKLRLLRDAAGENKACIHLVIVLDSNKVSRSLRP